MGMCVCGNISTHYTHVCIYICMYKYIYMHVHFCMYAYMLYPCIHLGMYIGRHT